MMTTHPHPYDEDLDRLRWGAADIGDAIQRSERQTYHLLNSGLLKARKVGAQHVATKRQLLAQINGEGE
jgi:hypothetical protein